MRRLLLSSVVGLAVLGCGGDDDNRRSLLPPVPKLTVPGEETTRLPRRRETETSTTESATETSESTSTATAPAERGGGEAAPATPAQPQQTQATPQAGTGSAPQPRFQDFCQENPGAC